MSSMFSEGRKTKQLNWPSIRWIHPSYASAELAFCCKWKETGFWKMLVYRRFKFCTSGMLSFHKFINGHLFQRLARCAIFKRGEYDNTPWHHKWKNIWNVKSVLKLWFLLNDMQQYIYREVSLSATVSFFFSITLSPAVLSFSLFLQMLPSMKGPW